MLVVAAADVFEFEAVLLVIPVGVHLGGVGYLVERRRRFGGSVPVFFGVLAVDIQPAGRNGISLGSENVAEEQGFE